MAIDAGCQWIEIDPSSLDSNDLESIINLARQAGIILVFHHHDNKLEELRVHGVRLSDGDTGPLAVREKLGGHPIIGVEVATDVELYTLKRADVDYVVMSGYPHDVTTDRITALNRRMIQQGIQFPIVIDGMIRTDDIEPLLHAGASGFNISLHSLQGPSYRESLASFIEKCASLQ